MGAYELIAELGKGGMGRVYLARRVGEAGFERFFAIKVILEDLESEPDAVLMLLDEARIASRIHHPNVVPITDMGVHEGAHFVAMDYVEGCSMSQLMRRTTGARPPQLVVPLIIDALRGVHAAHELRDHDGNLINLVHRDFSPPNLMVGVDGVCRVTDFGVVKATSRLTRTRASIQKGKISYMPPEQLTADADLDRRVDVWAAGVVLYYALTGEHPFRGRSHSRTIHKIMTREVQPPSTVGLKPPACFDLVCLRALERDREDRFESAQQMADELQKIAVRHDMLAPQSEVSQWVRELFSRELEARQQVIRQITCGDSDVTWLSAPVLPTLATSSSFAPRRDSDSFSSFGSLSSATGNSHSEHSRLQRKSSANQETPTKLARPTALPRRRRLPSALTLALATALSTVVGFLLLTALLNFVASRTDEPRPQASVAESEASTLPTPPRPESSPVSPQPVPIPEESEEELSSETTPAAAPRSEHASAGVPGHSEEQVEITLARLPEEASVRLDGRLVHGHQWSVPADGELHRLRVEAPGQRPWRRSFRASRDLTVTVGAPRR